MVVKKQPAGVSTRFPESLSLSDLISIISVAVSIALAWGYFGARISALEKQVIIIEADNTKRSLSIESLQDRSRVIESHVQDSELYIDQLYKMLKQVQPQHRTFETQRTYDTSRLTNNTSVTSTAQDFLAKH